MDILASLICPCFKNEKTIDGLISSLDAQDCAFPFEVLFVHDPSDDGTLSILEERAKTRPYMKVIAHKERVGVMSSRLEGIMKAEGKYIGFCDGDDALVPHYLSTMVGKLEQEQADAINCSFYTCDEKGRRMGYPFVCLRRKMNRKQALKALLADTGMRGFLWTKMIRADILKNNVLPVLPGRHGFEDVPYLFGALCHCDKVLSIPDKLYLYVKTEADSLTTRKYPLRAQEHLESFALVRYVADSDPELRKIVISAYLRFKASLDYDLYRSKKDGLSKEDAAIIRKAMKNLKKKGQFPMNGEIYESMVRQSLQTTIE